MSATPSADAALESATRVHDAAKKKLRWWLGSLAYAVFCLVGRRLLPRDLDPGFLIVLNSWGTTLATVVCAIGAADAFREERRERTYRTVVLQAWADERIAARRASETSGR